MLLHSYTKYLHFVSPALKEISQTTKQRLIETDIWLLASIRTIDKLATKTKINELVFYCDIHTNSDRFNRAFRKLTSLKYIRRSDIKIRNKPAYYITTSGKNLLNQFDEIIEKLSY